MERYERNRIYINSEEQELIKNMPILFGGCGIGSNIAECALRLGFENITLIDGDQVELSNLNRQNYVADDIATDKATAIKKRLLAINPNANIKTHNCFITKENLNDFIKDHKIAINALDFTSDIPLLFDEMCQKNNIPVIHPYNLGWGGLVAIISPKGLSLETIKRENEEFNELKVVEYATSYMRFWQKPQKWIEDVIAKYKNEQETLPPPQLSVASWLVASMCTNLLFAIATGKKTKIFPEFYLSNIDFEE
ncbi:MAG: ThiF family adenylyltransferase [Flavobacteriaceae bacterium]|nr:ThiF family adenylyltransferase [Flavobacteriaceae bacterium]